MIEASKESLKKDGKVLAKDYASIARQVAKKYEEKIEVENLIALARKELKSIEELKEPLIKTKKDYIDSLDKEATELRNEISKTKSLFKEEALSLKKSVSNLTKQRDSLSESISSLSDSIDSKIKDISVLKEKAEIAKREMEPVLTKRIAEDEKLESLEELIVSAENKLKRLNVEMEFFVKQRHELELSWEFVDKQMEKLEEEEKELYRLMDENKIMNERLKPEYIEVFKQFNNL
jgi:chromosome segregation ATPase